MSPPVIAWELQVIGSHGMSAVDYPALLDLVRAGRLKPERLLGSVVDLEGAIEALVAMDGSHAARGMVVARVASSSLHPSNVWHRAAEVTGRIDA